MHMLIVMSKVYYDDLSYVLYYLILMYKHISSQVLRSRSLEGPRHQHRDEQPLVRRRARRLPTNNCLVCVFYKIIRN